MAPTSKPTKAALKRVPLKGRVDIELSALECFDLAMLLSLEGFSRGRELPSPFSAAGAASGDPVQVSSLNEFNRFAKVFEFHPVWHDQLLSDELFAKLDRRKSSTITVQLEKSQAQLIGDMLVEAFPNTGKPSAAAEMLALGREMTGLLEGGLLESHAAALAASMRSLAHKLIMAGTRKRGRPSARA